MKLAKACLGCFCCNPQACVESTRDSRKVQQHSWACLHTLSYSWAFSVAFGDLADASQLGKFQVSFVDS